MSDFSYNCLCGGVHVVRSSADVLVLRDGTESTWITCPSCGAGPNLCCWTDKGLTQSSAYKEVSRRLRGKNRDFRGLSYDPKTGRAVAV